MSRFIIEFGDRLSDHRYYSGSYTVWLADFILDLYVIVTAYLFDYYISDFIKKENRTRLC